MLHLRGKKNCRKSVLQLRSSEGICCRWVQVPLPHLLNVRRKWGIAMNYLLRLTPSGIQIRGMAHPGVSASSALSPPLLLTILSLPACGGTCALNLVTGIWCRLHLNHRASGPGLPVAFQSNAKNANDTLVRPCYKKAGPRLSHQP
jgi:hypothetical protein